MTPDSSEEVARIASAPARINLLGEHIDHCGGTVLPLAVSLRTTVRYTPGDVWDLVSEGHDDDDWKRYPRAVIELLTEEGHDIVPGRIEISSNIPEAKGLSSSAALEVAVAGALLGETAPFDIARLCRRAENEKVGVPCGIMDQATVACAIAGNAMALDCADETFFHLPLPEMELLLFDPGLPRQLSDTEYAARLEEAREPGTEAARHVAEEQARVEKGIALLDDGDAENFGYLMSECHVSLRDLYRCSHEVIDDLVARLWVTPGVWGARMVGGGWGGCVIAVAEPGTHLDGGLNLVSDDGLYTLA